MNKKVSFEFKDWELEACMSIRSKENSKSPWCITAVVWFKFRTTQQSLNLIFLTVPLSSNMVMSKEIRCLNMKEVCSYTVICGLCNRITKIIPSQNNENNIVTVLLPRVVATPIVIFPLISVDILWGVHNSLPWALAAPSSARSFGMKFRNEPWRCENVLYFIWHPAVWQ